MNIIILIIIINYNEKLYTSKKVSKNLGLSVSAERKYNHNKILSPSNSIKKDNTANKININSEKNINIDNDINEYLYEKRNNVEKQILNYLKEAMITEKKIKD